MSSADLPEWWAEAQSLANEVRRDFHIFCLLTGMRPTAAKSARAEHLGPVRGILHVPKPKGGRRRAFDLPLSAYLCDMLQRRVDANGSKTSWIFPAETKSGHLEKSKSA